MKLMPLLFRHVLNLSNFELGSCEEDLLGDLKQNTKVCLFWCARCRIYSKELLFIEIVLHFEA